jgi:hypothetical protein
MKIKYWPLLLGPTLLYFFGAFLNVIAISANHGQMPVLTPDCRMLTSMAEERTDFIHTCMTSSTHLKFLCDWIVLNGVGVFSIGDGFLLLGDSLYSYGLIVWAALVILDK